MSSCRTGWSRRPSRSPCSTTGKTSAVIAEKLKRSPLRGHASQFAAASDALGDVLTIRELAFLSQLDLRADPGDVAVMERLRAGLGFALPQIPNTTSSGGDRNALWLGPDEWLVTGPEDQQELIEGALRSALSDETGARRRVHVADGQCEPPRPAFQRRVVGERQVGLRHANR